MKLKNVLRARPLTVTVLAALLALPIVATAAPLTTFASGMDGFDTQNEKRRQILIENFKAAKEMVDTMASAGIAPSAEDMAAINKTLSGGSGWLDGTALDQRMLDMLRASGVAKAEEVRRRQQVSEQRR